MSILFQVASTGIICFVCLVMGMSMTWPSSTILLFSSDNTTLHRIMTETEQSLLGSLPSISGILVTPFSGYMMDRFGRKWSCIVFYLPTLVFWAVVTICTSVEAILFAQFASGLSSCTFLIMPLYISEFCEDTIRGSMTSTSMAFYGIGMLVSYLMGGLLEYHAMNYVGTTLTVIGLVLLSIMKESPLYLMKVGREQDAVKALAFFKNAKVDSKEIENEVEKIRKILKSDVEETPAEEKRLNVEEAAPVKLSKWQYLKKCRTTQRALFVTFVLYTAAIFQGLVVVQVYARPLFAVATPSMSTTLCSVLSAAVTVISCFISAYLIDVVGRRPLMIYASMATGVSCVLLGSQIEYSWGPNWLTAVIIYLYCVTFTLGAGSVPFVIVVEVFMPEIKSFTSMIASEWVFICNFVILFIFGPLVNSLGLGAVFYIFAACCFLSGIFSYYFLPETKGLSVDVIQMRFQRSIQINNK